MSNYIRYRVPGGCYFFTVNLLERTPNDLLVRHIDVLRTAVTKVRQKRPFHIDAWVVLPDHLHCVWTLPPGDDDFTNRWRLIKQPRTAQSVGCNSDSVFRQITHRIVVTP